MALLLHSEATYNNIQAHQEHLNRVLLMLENQDNHHQKNERLKSIPKSVAHEALLDAAMMLFSNLLGPVHTNKIIILRPLRPKPAAAAPPDRCGL